MPAPHVGLQRPFVLACAPVLGARSRECARIVNRLEGHTVEQIFGYPDDLKFRSSMTLFAQVAAENAVFLKALEKYFGGEPYPRTLELLKRDAE